MGWCHEFGPDINADCGHPMVADAKSCKCTTCGVVCTGRFSGCAAVWAAGPRKVKAVRGAARSRRPAPSGAMAEVAPADEGEATPTGEGAATLVDALRAELLTVTRRLDDVQVDSLRTDLASVMHQLEKLTSAVVTQHQELQRLVAERTAPPAQQRMVEQPPPKPPQADRGPQPEAKQPQAKQPQAKQPQAKQPQDDRRPQQPQGQRRPEQARPNGGSPAPARTTPTSVPGAPSAVPTPPSPVTPAPGEPEQVDLAVPLDQALVRPVRPGEQGPR